MASYKGPETNGVRTTQVTHDLEMVLLPFPGSHTLCSYTEDVRSRPSVPGYIVFVGLEDQRVTWPYSEQRKMESLRQWIRGRREPSGSRTGLRCWAGSTGAKATCTPGWATSMRAGTRPKRWHCVSHRGPGLRPKASHCAPAVQEQARRPLLGEPEPVPWGGRG